jgi:hypothetical protein
VRRKRKREEFVRTGGATLFSVGGDDRLGIGGNPTNDAVARVVASARVVIAVT